MKNMDGDLFFVQAVDRRIQIRNKTGIIEGPLGRQLNIILAHYGYEELFQNTFVNMNTIMDYKDNKVYFDAEKQIFCPVSRKNEFKVKRFFDKKDQD